MSASPNKITNVIFNNVTLIGEKMENVASFYEI